MAKIGSKIQETRLRKGLTLDRIADDTNISVRFLAKIENDDFTGFPGEPYVVGFIRNYADYLGLDAEVVVALYRSKGDETPPPAQATAAAPASQAGTSHTAPDVAGAALDQSIAPAPASASAEFGGRAEDAAPKPRKGRKAPAATAAAAGAAAAASPGAAINQTAGDTARAFAAEKSTTGAAAVSAGTIVESRQPGVRKSAAQKEKAATKIEAPLPSASLALPDTKKPSALPLRSMIIAILALAIVAVAILWIVAGGTSSSLQQTPVEKAAKEYRVEGSPFETRLYIGDSLLIPIGNDVYKISLASISDTVNLETPFGALQLALGEASTLDPDKNGIPDASLIVGDFEKNKPTSGALIKVELSPAEAIDETPGEITIPGTPAASPAATAAVSPAADTVILRSTRGPYPIVVQVTFRGNCLFRYEVDRKEWVEKYFSKGESLTINVTNSLTVWTSNAQAVKLSFQASGGKTADLEIGAPGEIAVKRISWSRAEGSWALISSDLD